MRIETHQRCIRHVGTPADVCPFTRQAGCPIQACVNHPKGSLGPVTMPFEVQVGGK